MASPEQPGTTETALEQPFERGDLYRVRAAVAAHASELGGSPMQVNYLVLIASELVTNAIAYAGGHGTIRLWRADSQLHCEVSDDGPGIPNAQTQGLQQPPASAQRGRGLWVARKLADGLEITTGTSGATVTVTMRLEKAEPVRQR
ncbi:MAG TPA: hypothetical protein DGT23_16180 [Micromonosporaceae bacterium]|nr:hypothetical protein [Micromonosporaceae bacterium]